jgi:hypothetical protein
MHYSDILAKFLSMFPQYQELICQWSPRAGHAIRVKTHSGQSLDFTYYNDREWTLAAVNPSNRRI